MNTKFAATILLILACKASSAQTVDVAPYRYPQVETASASDAQKDFNRTLRRIDPGHGKIAQDWTIRCSGLDGKMRRCIEVGGLNYYQPQYVPYTTNRPLIVPSSGGTSGGVAELGWVRIDSAIGGQEKIKELEVMLAKRERIECNNETAECMTIVEGIPANKEERVLAACNVTVLGDEAGAVRRCVPVAIISTREIYIRAVVAYAPGLATRLIDSPTIDIEFHVESNPGGAFLPSLNAALSAAQDALSAAPISLTTELRPRSNPVRVIGVAGLRVSPVLERTWREKVSIRVDVDREEGENGVIELTASFNLQFNKQNTDRPEDFRPPSEVQLNRYKDVFSEAIRQRLPKLCRSAFWKDSITLVCRGQ
jgi:hypothetical protein